MRWTLEPIRRIGDERTITRFLWLPLELNREVRWLERATWAEVCRGSRHGLWWDQTHWINSQVERA